MPSRLENLLRRQEGVATIPQLVATGTTAHRIRAHVDARRWQRYGDRCVLAHNSVPSRVQWMWIAVLDNRGPAALAGFSALEARGFPGTGVDRCRVRHKQAMRLAVHDIAGGAEALSEIDIAGMCRLFGLVPPDRQVVRRDRDGRRRYLDCEWHLPDGRVLVLEIDGAHHMRAEHWEADLRRERGIVTSGRRVLRCTANEARHDQAALAADRAAVGVPTTRRVVSAWIGQDRLTR